MGFISKAERKANAWVAKQTGLPPPSRSPEERASAYGDFVERQNEAASQAAAQAAADAAKAADQARTPIRVVSPDPATTPIKRSATADDEFARRRAAAAGGQAGLMLPPVGVRGAGALPRTSLLGR